MDSRRFPAVPTDRNVAGAAGGAPRASRLPMRLQTDRLWRVVLSTCVIAASACGPAPDAATPAADVVVVDAWMRATPAGAPVAGGYLTLRNIGRAPDRLSSVHSPAAREVQIHEVRYEGGIARMRRLTDGLALAPGSTVALKPGGAHLMFLDPVRPLAEGDRVTATLNLERSGPIEITIPVRSAGAAEASEHAGH